MMVFLKNNYAYCILVVIEVLLCTVQLVQCATDSLGNTHGHIESFGIVTPSHDEYNILSPSLRKGDDSSKLTIVSEYTTNNIRRLDIEDTSLPNDNDNNMTTDDDDTMNSSNSSSPKEEEEIAITENEDDKVEEHVTTQEDDASSTTTNSKSGEHKSLLPLNRSDYIGISFAILGLLIAAGGGIGGGAILVPIYLLIMKFTPKYAVSLSIITVLGGSVANMMFFLLQRHPIHDKPLIDWDLILMMEPFAMLGAVFGVLTNKVIPELVLTLLLVLLLSYTCYETLKKAISMYQKETIAINNSKNGSSSTNNSNNSKGTTSNTSGKVGYQSIATSDSTDDDSSFHNQYQHIVDSERHIPLRSVIILFSTVFIVLLINFLKGGTNTSFPSMIGIQCGSFYFWFMNIIVIIVVLSVAFYSRTYLLSKHQQKVLYHYPYANGDVLWNEKNTTLYPLLCTSAGFFAGMFGIGGGMVKGPLMLAMGVLPTVSAASVAVMIFCTSFTATTSNIVFGLLLPDYGLLLFTVGFLSTLFGQMCLAYLMKQSKRNSYIAFSIGFVVLISAILMTFQSILSIVTKISEGSSHTLLASPGGICA